MTPNTCNVENVTHINYHSDFRLIIRFNSDKLPDYPWRITFSTPSTHTVDKYVASFDGENYINCKPVDTLPGAAIVFFDHHRLGCGTLGYILDMDIPDNEFPDGKMDIEIPGVETVELWPGKSDETELPAEIIVALLQMLKGFSPSIEVEENSDDSYILRITNETGSYLTPNLRASLNLAQSTGDSQYIAMSQDATTKALAAKVDKEEGKGLSTNDYTDQEKEKLAGLSNYDDTEIRKELSDKASKQELTEAAAGALAKAKSYTDTKTTELWNNVSDVFDAMSEELNSNISGGDAQTLTEAKNYTDKAISEIPTPDVSGQIERHNTSPTAHPDIRELLNTCVGLPEFNDKTYELTFTTKGGAKFIIDLPIEMMGLHYNEDTQSIEFVNADGSISSIPVSDFVKVYVGSIGSEIQVTVEGSEIRASLLNNTVSWDKLTLALQEMIQGKADRTELPTKLSELENDSGYVTSEELNTELGYKDHVAYILKDFTKSYYNNTGSDITDRSMVVTPTQSGVTSNFSLTSRIPVAASDFIFVRMKLRVDKECSLRIITYSDNLDQRGRWFVLKADRTYEIYYRGKAASVAGGLNVGTSISAATNIGQKVTIEDLIVTLNNYDAWCDAESRATLKNFDTDSFTVDEGGTGHFFSVAQACDFARDAFDVVNNAVTVFIRNGLYDHEAPKNVAMGYPYAIINKGANRISLIGESRDGVIVSYENNSVNRAKIIEAGGECTIANMTVNCLNDESYTDASAGGHQACYCIHIDSVFAASERYFTTVRNCKLFSTCHSPVGAGLADNQTIRLDGCECVSDTHVGTSTGAATIHASTDAAAKNMAVEIIGCRRSPRLRHHRGRNDDGAGGGGMVAAVVGRGLPADARQGVFRR